MKKSILRTFAGLVVLLGLCASLTGCLSHWFIETTSRLQVENATEDCSLVGVDVLSEDSVTFRSWISETLLPGERSHVVEEDWVGEFTIQVKYTKSADGSGEILKDILKMELEGGSLYLVVESDGDSLSYRFR